MVRGGEEGEGARMAGRATSDQPSSGFICPRVYAYGVFYARVHVCVVHVPAETVVLARARARVS